MSGSHSARASIAMALLVSACASNPIRLEDDEDTGAPRPGSDTGDVVDLPDPVDGPGATSMIAPEPTDSSGPPRPVCGDGVIDPDEECDGEALGDQSCESLGAFGGEVHCDDACALDLEGCVWARPEGKAVISEIFYSPLAVPLSVPGQWLELHNPDPAAPVSLAGCEIDGGSHFETFGLGDLSISPGGYVSLGTGTPAELGMTPDFTIPPGFILMNEGDVIELRCEDETVDAVVYDDAAPWPAFAPGIAIALRPGHLGTTANDEGAAWCAATTEYGLGQRGTPGAPNDCP